MKAVAPISFTTPWVLAPRNGDAVTETLVSLQRWDFSFLMTLRDDFTPLPLSVSAPGQRLRLATLSDDELNFPRFHRSARLLRARFRKPKTSLSTTASGSRRAMELSERRRNRAVRLSVEAYLRIEPTGDTPARLSPR
jgi:hypothetical protein